MGTRLLFSIRNYVGRNRARMRERCSSYVTNRGTKRHVLCEFVSSGRGGGKVGRANLIVHVTTGILPFTL